MEKQGADFSTVYTLVTDCMWMMQLHYFFPLSRKETKTMMTPSPASSAFGARVYEVVVGGVEPQKWP